MNNIGHWQFDKEFNPEEWVGFVYEITHLSSGRKYLGKKFFWSTTRKAVKDRKNKKKVVKESNWKSYTGSSKWLLSEIALHGKENFSFKILSLHETRSSLAWSEVERIVSSNALRAKLMDGTKAYFNALCPPIKFTVNDESEKERMYKT